MKIAENDSTASTEIMIESSHSQKKELLGLGYDDFTVI